jgi:hypothetical protein
MLSLVRRMIGHVVAGAIISMVVVCEGGATTGGVGLDKVDEVAVMGMLLGTSSPSSHSKEGVMLVGLMGVLRD